MQNREKLARVKLLVLDVDGVLTEGDVTYGTEGLELKTFNVKDGLGIRLAMNFGLAVAIATGRKSDAVARRARELGVTQVLQNASDKESALRRLCESLAVPLEHTAFLADDLNDLPGLKMVGAPMAVADAAPEVRAAAVYVTRARGGRGAAREAIEAILSSQGKWQEAVASYLNSLKKKSAGTTR
jgi:3-deoxy-D-manno-octulosonate 8-phosphate phosphatase (KDO 8-P phosphatase)